ncbi:leucine-rich repeat transmembrane neuronal protein 2-like isoform X2 [Contarinia nasturtii]|uniref:leucine-rich repeat transmembrane neuronal protein 2-like isoform X2 n=1 Tax=Contarinia nasturtii TaxID=265458 RepID=UPI0012D40487|nr:leucine-rich repeat transmembrane neuronal protein 2-like isoform X2 [Contarinia nasturtii]
MSSKICKLLLLASIFSFIPSLTSFHIRVYFHDRRSSSIDGKNICKCKNLTNVYAANSSIELLPSRFLANCHSLEYLVLSNNKLTEIPYDAFYNLSNLYSLDLSVNQLTTLPRDVFKPLTNLMSLILTENRIEIIDSNMFFHNQNFGHLNIHSNNLRTIEPKSFIRTFKRLSNSLNLANNRNLNSDDFFHEIDNFEAINVANCGFKELFIPRNVDQINAIGNDISYITAHPNSTLRSLFLSHNSFTNLSRIPSLVNLQSLLIGNGIDHINFFDLSHLKKLKYLLIELNPKQNISVAEIKKSLPSFRKLYITSPDLSIEKQKRILNDFKEHKLNISINGKEYPWEREQKEKFLNILRCFKT